MRLDEPSLRKWSFIKTCMECFTIADHGISCNIIIYCALYFSDMWDICYLYIYVFLHCNCESHLDWGFLFLVKQSIITISLHVCCTGPNAISGFQLVFKNNEVLILHIRWRIIHPSIISIRIYLFVWGGGDGCHPQEPFLCIRNVKLSARV